MRKVKEFMQKYWLGCMCVLTVLIFAVVLVVSSFCGEKKSLSASAEEVTASAASTTQPRASSGIDLSKYPTANLISYPYAKGTDTLNGVTFTVNNDGTIIANGTATENAIFVFHNFDFSLSAGTYTISGLENGEADTYCLQISRDNYIENWNLYNGNIQLNLENTSSMLLQFVVYKGASVNNVVLKPMINAGETAYPYSPPYDLIYNDGYNKGESAGHEAGYQEGYEEAVDKLSNVLITEGNGEYATARNKVVGYVGGTDYLQFDTASGSADLTGLPSDPYVSLRLQVSIDASSQYVISYDSLAGYCSLGFFIDDVMFNLFTLPETTKPVTINFTLPYGLNGGTYVVDELFLLGYKEPLDFDFDENHYKTGGPCVLKGMKLYCRFDGEGAYNAGYEVGYNEGSKVSEQEKQEKYEEGKQAGYNQGISEKTNAFSYINAIITAPVDAVLSMFDVDFMGWNLKGLLGLLVCGAIIAIVIKVLL